MRPDLAEAIGAALAHLRDDLTDLEALTLAALEENAVESEETRDD